MTARHIGSLLPHIRGLQLQRSEQRVRRDSYLAGTRDHEMWRPLGRTNSEARKAIALRMQAAERYDRENKRKGERNGPLGHIGLEVLRELYRIVDYRTGRLEPAIATICAKICRARAAVNRALKRLKEHGFLDWIRRSEPTGNVGSGPQIRQITNAYSLLLPRAAAAWVKRLLIGAPPAPCEIARREHDRVETNDMIKGANPQDVATFYAAGTELEAILGRLGALISASSPSGQKPDPSFI